MNEAFIKSKINDAQNGITVESTNLDLKQEWWDLTDREKEEEFVKDVAAMANNPSGDSYIIIGVDEHGKIYNAPLPIDEANLQTKLKDKIESRVDVNFKELNIDGEIISVVFLPHSKNRPHVVKRYKNQKNFIFVRKGTTTETASKYDLDEMYEEKSKKTEADVNVEIYDEKIDWQDYSDYRGYCYRARLTVDNYTGNAPDYITHVVLKEHSGDLWESKYFKFYYEDRNFKYNGELKVEAHERLADVMVFLSDEPPNPSGGHRFKPSLDIDTVKLHISTRSGKEIIIPIKSANIA